MVAAVVVAVIAEADAVVTTSANPGRVTTTTPLLLPISPVSGRANPAGFGAAKSGVYGARIWQVFGTPLKRPTGRADADAQFPGDDLPRGAGGSEGGDLAGVDGDWRVAGAMGVWTKSLARRTLRRWLSPNIDGGVSLGSQEVYRDPSSAAHAG